MKIENFKLKIAREKGFTLIELLLYVSLTAMMLLSVSIFLSVILQARVKNQTIAVVEQEGARVNQIINQTIRNATAINSPAPGGSAATLSLNTAVPANNPTVFDLSGGTLRITEGEGSPVALTSNLVIVSSLNFHNLTVPSSPPNVRFSFTIAHN